MAFIPNHSSAAPEGMLIRFQPTVRQDKFYLRTYIGTDVPSTLLDEVECASLEASIAKAKEMQAALYGYIKGYCEALKR